MAARKEPKLRQHGASGSCEEWHMNAGDLDIVLRAEDHSQEIVEAMQTAIARALYKIGLVAEGFAKKLCPVDTGRLRNSITFDMDGTSVYIGTNVEYAEYVENGTSKRKATPYLVPAATEHISEYRSIIEKEMESG